MTALRACGFALLVAGGLQACCFRSCEPGQDDSATAASADVPAGTLDIVGWGPQGTRAGVAFNPQPDGHSTLWIRVAQPLDGRTGLVQFGDTFLEGSVSGTLLTAGIPAALYAVPGRYEVRAIARTDDALWKSAPVSFTVGPARPAP